MPSSVNSSRSDSLLSTLEKGSLLADSQWTLMLDSVSEGISVHSSTGEILWVNKKLCDIYGKSRSLLEGLNCEQVFHVEGPPCTHEQVIATGCGGDLESEVKVSGRSLTVRIEPIFDKRKRVHGFMRLMRDVTSERHVQAQLLNAERFATLGQILSGIAHDVGTPLNIISGYSEFLLMRTKPDDRGYKEISTILAQTRRIAQLLSEAVDLTRVPQGQSAAIDLKELLADALGLVGHYFRKTGVKAVLTCRMGSALIYGEASQLKQAFFNLLLSAAREVDTGGKLEIVIDESANRPGFLTIALWGSEASGLGHDFSQSLVRFFAADSEAGAVGLGLSLAKTILAEARAEVASSEAGTQGAPLIVYLPVNTDSRA